MIEIKINELLNKHNQTIYWLAKKLGMSHNNLTNIIKGKTTSIKFEILDKICETLDCNIQDIIEYVPNKEKSKEIIVSASAFEESNKNEDKNPFEARIVKGNPNQE